MTNLLSELIVWDRMNINIEFSKMKTISLQVKPTNTIDQVLQALNIPPDQKCLTYNGKVLKESRTLQKYRIKEYDTLKISFISSGEEYADWDCENVTIWDKLAPSETCVFVPSKRRRAKPNVKSDAGTSFHRRAKEDVY